MRIAPVEIFSDQTNAAIMRHPGRRFPGVLVQGDTLSRLCRQADEVCREIGRTNRSSLAYDEADELRDTLRSLLSHYKSVLLDHDLPLPFVE